jgi:hypothetical protein
VWAFAWYWFVKTKEMRESEAERRALDAELEREVVPVTPPAEAAATGPGGMSGRFSESSPRIWESGTDCSGGSAQRPSGAPVL